MTPSERIDNNAKVERELNRMRGDHSTHGQRFAAGFLNSNSGVYQFRKSARKAREWLKINRPDDRKEFDDLSRFEMLLDKFS